jgi:hypothetical protein
MLCEYGPLTTDVFCLHTALTCPHFTMQTHTRDTTFFSFPRAGPSVASYVSESETQRREAAKNAKTATPQRSIPVPSSEPFAPLRHCDFALNPEDGFSRAGLRARARNLGHLAMEDTAEGVCATRACPICGRGLFYFHFRVQAKDSDE